MSRTEDICQQLAALAQMTVKVPPPGAGSKGILGIPVCSGVGREGREVLR